MKVHNPQGPSQLAGGLQRLLDSQRQARAFDAARYLQDKSQLLIRYASREGLQALVVAVSGGLDSAVTLGICAHAMRQPGSPVSHVEALLLPVNRQGTSGQESATTRGVLTCEAFGVRPSIIELGEAHDLYDRLISDATGLGQGPFKRDPWALGQLAAHLRTPALAYTATLLTAGGMRAAVAGTTNRDEGAYLGYVGKWSDGMVDLQVISDLHKSEVRAVAQVLVVPDEILSATPTGDMFDGRSDADVMGAPYDFVELYLGWLCLPAGEQRAALKSLDAQERAQWDELASHLEALHRYNAHKYIASSPAVHLDLLPSAVPGGWTGDESRGSPTGTPGPSHRAALNTHADLKAFGQNGSKEMQAETRDKQLTSSQRLDPEVMARPAVAPFELELPLSAYPRKQASWHDVGEYAQAYDHLLLPAEASQLQDILDRQQWQPVGLDGVAANYREGDPIGSWRLTADAPSLAAALWQRMKGAFGSPQLRADTPADLDGHLNWVPVGINPRLRFIRYRAGGLLVPHYDGPYIAPDGDRSLATLVIYLGNRGGAQGGATRFIRDPQAGVPLAQRDLSDWERPAREDEVEHTVQGQPGSAITFWHRLLHDSERIQGEGDKTIIRSDIMFRRIG